MILCGHFNFNNVPLHFRSLLFGLILVPHWGLCATGDTPPSQTDVKDRLESVQREIRSLRDQVSASQGKMGRLQLELGRIETELGAIGRQIKSTEENMLSLQEQGKALADRQVDLRGTLDDQRKALAAHVRAAYVTGRQEKLKVMLNHKDPSSIGRHLTYLDYLASARKMQIEAVLDTLSELEAMERQRTANATQLSEHAGALNAQRQRLEQTQHNRNDTLASLQEAVRKKNARLGQLVQDEQELSRLLSELRNALVDIPLSSSETESFAARRGKLVRPTQGKLENLFGKVRKGTSGKLKWQGVLIHAPRNEDVRSVTRGRVVFSDWMRGYGLIVIVDHGKGFMTLYGYNQTLYKSPGDWVQAGDVIAGVGDTGGQSRPALYFEIRHNGKPVNPAKWLAPDTAMASRKSAVPRKDRSGP